MKQWQETSRILRRTVELRASGRRAAVATVIRIDGSAYRRPGAKLLIEETGDTLGGVSGGCLEADVRERGLMAVRDCAAHVAHYETGSDESVVWGLGLGCDGSVDVFIQPTDSEETIAAFTAIEELLAGDESFTVSTVVEGDYRGQCLVATRDRIVSGSMGDAAADRSFAAGARDILDAGQSVLVDVAGGKVFTEVHLPPPRVSVIGAGDDAMPLVRLAADVGFRVAVVDHRPSYVERERFPNATQLFNTRAEQGLEERLTGEDAFAVVMTHSLTHDRAWVEYLLSTPIRYIGLLGPRGRTESIVEQIGGPGDRVFGPVGLDVGADGPEQVALSVVAELLAVQSARQPGHLRDRENAIHAV